MPFFMMICPFLSFLQHPYYQRSGGPDKGYRPIRAMQSEMRENSKIKEGGKQAVWITLRMDKT